MYSVSSSKPVVNPGRIGDSRSKLSMPKADVVILVGPEQDPYLVAAARRECEANGLNAIFLGDAEKGFHPAQLHELRRSGRLGPNTHVIAIAHGSKRQVNLAPNMQALVPQRPLQHTVTFPQSWDNEPTTAVIAGLRAPLEDLPPWTGPFHLISCQAGRLIEEVQPGTPLWQAGHVLIYGGGDDIPAKMPNEDLACVLHFIGECNRQGRVADAMQSFAHLATITGENVTMLGGDLDAPLIVHAPQSAADIQPGALAADLRRQEAHARFEQQSRRRLEGASHDLMRFREVVRSVGNPNSRVPAAKMLHVQADRGSPGDVGRLLDIYPDLLDVAGPDGRTPLMRAMIGKKFAVVELLLARGANPNVTIIDGRSPLQLAWESPELMLLLCRHGADPSRARLGGGQTIMSVLTEQRSSLAVELQEAHRAFLVSGRPVSRSRM